MKTLRLLLLASAGLVAMLVGCRPGATATPAPVTRILPSPTATPGATAVTTKPFTPSATAAMQRATAGNEATPAATPTPSAPTATPSLSDASPAVAALAAKLQGLDLDAFFEVSWRELMLRDPEAVVEAGLAGTWGLQEATLTDISDTYIRETYQMYALILDLLQRYDRAALTADQQISYDVYEWWLKDQLAGQRFMYYDYPATFFPVTAVHELIIQFFTDIHPVSDAQEARDYVTRLKQVGIKIDQLLENLRLRENAGVIPPKFATQWALYGGVRDLAGAPATRTPFYTAFEAKVKALGDLSADEKQALLQEAEGAIDDVVLPAYSRLADYLKHLESIGSDQDGVWQFPDGEAYYDYLLHHNTTTDLTADEIHALGLSELERVHAEMRVIFDALGYPQDESLAQLFDRVARDSGHVSGQQVLDTYAKLIAEAGQKLDDAFDVRPQAEVVVLGDDYGGFYVPGAVDGSRPGAFYATLGGKGEDYYGMPTLAYHETIPGHHLQIALAQESDLPAFRRWVSFTGYTEGWALYAERLAWELGWYTGDPYGDLGRLQAEAFRAARLVVDTGIHAQGWDFDRALDFFVENVGYEAGDIVNPEHQIARYIVWPGQATAYQIGMIEILQLRQEAMDALGDRFDLKAFHRLVLGNGSMPLEMLERLVEHYIAQQTADAWVAFYSERDGNAEIYTMNPDGSSQRRLTSNEFEDSAPVWSPDGSRIAFISDRDDPRAGKCFPNCLYQIYVIDPDGSDEHRLIETEFTTHHPDWHPDGTKLSFDTEFNLKGDIYVANVDGSDLQQLIADGFWADWSPDGTQIAFASNRDGNVEIYLADADGSNQRRLTANQRMDLFPAWSPDGEKIAFMVREDGGQQLFVMNADGSDEQQLTFQGRVNEDPDWSPDGSQLLFQSNRDGNFEIYALDVEQALRGENAGGLRRLTSTAGGDYWPARRPVAIAAATETPAPTPTTTPPTPVSWLPSPQEFDARGTFQAGLGDLDGDGDLDAVFANPLRHNSEVWLNDGTGTLIDTAQQLTPYGHGVGLADFDGDGDLDAFIACHQFVTPSSIYLNDGTGRFQDTGQDLGDKGTSATEVNLLDLDGDGHTDVHVLYYDPNGMPDRVYLNDGAANFTDSGLALDEDTIAWGDLDGDGDVDYFGKRWGQGYVVQLNDGSGRFTPGLQIADPQSTVGEVALADLDGDGDLDVFVGSLKGRPEIWFNAGTP
jgi:uncharacterized protein (DUF885 family)